MEAFITQSMCHILDPSGCYGSGMDDSTFRSCSLHRRQWLQGVTALVAVEWAGARPSTARASAAALTLPPLPYRANALAPHLSKRTLSLHHGKHHQTYVDKTNQLIAGTELVGRELADIVRASAGKPERQPLFNNAAQAWNHAFYWQSMRPKGGGTPSGELAQRIDSSFGSFDAFAKEFTAAATAQLGSGWAWLVADGDKLAVFKTGNADTPIASGKRPLLTLDVWEHAYYLDYQNKRADYVKAFLDHLANWEFAAANLG